MIDADIFRNLSQQLDSQSDLSTSICKLREDVYSYNKNIFTFKGNFKDKSGLCRKTIKNIIYSCLYINGSSNSLHVSFSGAKMPGHNYITKPGVSRWSYHRLYDGCFLGIDDPMYYKYPNLNLGWYYGDKDNFYLNDSLELVDHVCLLNNIDRKRVTFFSSSGGGYAALMAALYYPGSLSISLNPQIFIANWEYSPIFSSITGIDLSRNDRFCRNDPLALMNDSKSWHLILANASSELDMDTQIKPLVKRMKKSLRYGLNHFGRILIWLYDAPGAPDAHTSFETRSIYWAIDHIANQFKDNEVFDAEYYQPLVLMINEMWHDLYQSKHETEEAKAQLQNNLAILDSIRDIKSRILT